MSFKFISIAPNADIAAVLLREFAAILYIGRKLITMTIQEVSPDVLSLILGAIMFLIGIAISFAKNNLLAFLFFMCGLFLLFYAMILFVIKICKKVWKNVKQ